MDSKHDLNPTCIVRPIARAKAAAHPNPTRLQRAKVVSGDVAWRLGLGSAFTKAFNPSVLRSLVVNGFIVSVGGWLPPVSTKYGSGSTHCVP